jgi:hypothetical protein
MRPESDHEMKSFCCKHHAMEIAHATHEQHGGVVSMGRLWSVRPASDAGQVGTWKKVVRKYKSLMYLPVRPIFHPCGGGNDNNDDAKVVFYAKEE